MRPISWNAADAIEQTWSMSWDSAGAGTAGEVLKDDCMEMHVQVQLAMTVGGHLARRVCCRRWMASCVFTTHDVPIQAQWLVHAPSPLQWPESVRAFYKLDSISPTTVQDFSRGSERVLLCLG
jgi:hypothetical protein